MDGKNPSYRKAVKKGYDEIFTINIKEKPNNIRSRGFFVYPIKTKECVVL